MRFAGQRVGRQEPLSAGATEKLPRQRGPLVGTDVARGERRPGANEHDDRTRHEAEGKSLSGGPADSGARFQRCPTALAEARAVAQIRERMEGS